MDFIHSLPLEFNLKNDYSEVLELSYISEKELPDNNENTWQTLCP